MKKIEYLIIPLALVMALLATSLSVAVSANTAAPSYEQPVGLAVATAPSLGTASSFGVLAGSTATNTGTTTISGDLGVSPGTAITGFPPGTYTGALHAGDAVAHQAQTDLTTAYNDLAGQACDANLTGQDLGGMTLTPGVYCFDTSAQLTGAVTLNAEGDPDAVFVFQIGSTLTTASDASVVMINGANQCNVYWQIGSSATLGTNTAFAGSILALTDITLNTGADVVGRALARTGAVTMDTNDISYDLCSAAPLIPTVVPTETLSPTETSVVSPTETSVVSPTETPVVSPTETSVVSPTATSPLPSAPTSAPVSAPATETPTSVSLTPTAEAAQAELPAAGVAGAAAGNLGGLIAGASVSLSAVAIWLRKRNRA